jgi:hypothetical protein
MNLLFKNSNGSILETRYFARIKKEIESTNAIYKEEKKWKMTETY